MVLLYRNPLQHSRKKSLPDSSFLHRSDSSQPPYQPLEMPTGGKISLKTTCIHLKFALISGKIESLSLWSMLGPDTRSQREETQVIEMQQIPPPPMKVFNMLSSLSNPHHPHYSHHHHCHHQFEFDRARHYCHWRSIVIIVIIVIDRVCHNSGSWVPAGQTGESIPQFGEVMKRQMWQILFKELFCQLNTCFSY